VQPTVEPTSAEHIWNIALFTQIATRQREIAFEMQHGNDGGGHDFCIAHLSLAIFPMMERLEHVITKAKHYYNLGIHEFLRSFGGRDTPTLLENSWIFSYSPRQQLGLI
jgi:hypothetical protein